MKHTSFTFINPLSRYFPISKWIAVILFCLEWVWCLLFQRTIDLLLLSKGYHLLRAHLKQKTLKRILNISWSFRSLRFGLFFNIIGQKWSFLINAQKLRLRSNYKATRGPYPTPLWYLVWLRFSFRSHAKHPPAPQSCSLELRQRKKHWIFHFLVIPQPTLTFSFASRTSLLVVWFWFFNSDSKLSVYV